MADFVARQQDRRMSLILHTLLLAGLALFAFNLQRAGWPDVSPFPHLPTNELKSVQLLYGTVPRFIVALAGGCLLGLATALMQQGLRNPLAEPGTVGLLAASRFAVALSLIWLPTIITSFVMPALVGALVGLAVVLALSYRGSFSPLFLILNGLILGLLLEAFTSILILTHFDELGDLLLWQAGSLVQDNWNTASTLTIILAAVVGGIAVLRRPLSLLDLDDASAGNLGVSPRIVRFVAVALSATIAAIVTSQLGVLAFVGLGGSALASLSGARRFSQRAVFSALLSAALLLLTDQTLQVLETVIAIPAGTATALLAAPLILLLLRKVRSPVTMGETRDPHIRERTGRLWFIFCLAISCLTVAIIGSLTIGRTPDGFFIATNAELSELLPWRWPRVMATGAAGGMIAMAGCLMQRMTGNSLASPELLGVSSGAALIMLPVIFLLPPLTRPQTMVIAAGGSLLFLVIALRLAKRSAYAPERLLLSGLAVTALSGSLLSMVAYFGDIRLTRLVGWLSGSAYSVTPCDAFMTLISFVGILGILPFVRRWLTMLPLGETTATSLGVNTSAARLTIIIVTALLTGVATVIIGPISFIGLMVPHLVRLLGIHKPIGHIYGCAIFGSVLMIFSDWIGRIVAFPWDVPAGIVASVIGGLAYGITIRTRR
ncbi:Fe(3+)-hydroxamate ABC transporter permease FhuB [Agrobacterium tumefaciens]|uniref:Fe(3+)-hydroxamate ABC transporter permease FhuB n=1 Tax=Agrobacterium tumefaciens TaxID=358 RepID=UPI0021CFDA2D|nr:Fe(3+)-hydroxamate ABC transporter permease FhuB [Agrobacterium tumefaciens]UXS03756.1 Fe(3+)-hydroxamate ABC transporter permease FhuB [Agrobacterium tumefaciens]